jgi:hypothetical protein
MAGTSEPRDDRTADDHKRAFHDQLLALRNVPEFAQSTKFEMLRSENMAKRWMTSAEMFEAAFGDRGAAYWRAALSEPMSPHALASLLALHLAGEQIDCSIRVDAAVPLKPEWPRPPRMRQQSFRLAVLEALKVGVEGGSITTLPTLSRDNPEDDHLGGCYAEVNRRNRKRPPAVWQYELRLDPRAAVTWLMAAPLRQHLVPPSLRLYLEPEQRPEAAEREIAEKVAAKPEPAPGAAGQRLGLESVHKKRGTNAAPPTAAEADIEAAVKRHHPMIEVDLILAVRADLPGRNVSGNRVVKAKNGIFGPSPIGRPKRPK